MISLLEANEYSKIIKLGETYDKRFSSKYLSNNNSIFVYQKQKNILGFLITEMSYDEVSIVLLYVSLESRHQGIGSMLLEFLISKVKGYSKIILEVSINNKAAINLYQKYGFYQISTRKKYYKDGSDALVMEKRLDNE